MLWQKISSLTYPVNTHGIRVSTIPSDVQMTTDNCRILSVHLITSVSSGESARLVPASIVGTLNISTTLPNILKLALFYREVVVISCFSAGMHLHTIHSLVHSIK